MASCLSSLRLFQMLCLASLVIGAASLSAGPPVLLPETLAGNLLMPIQTVEDPKPQPRLAIYTRPIRKATADRLKITPTGQMEVIFAVPGGGGGKIGLQPGDVVIRINGRDVPNDKDATAALKELKTGERLELIVERIGGSKTLVGRYETFFTPVEDASRSSKLAEQGDAQAQDILGECYKTGRGSRKPVKRWPT